MNLGSKFWQSRWEQQLEDEEASIGQPFTRLFSPSRQELRQVVTKSLDRYGEWRWRIDRRLWYWALLRKPSVSLMMTYLSAAFVLFWVAALVGLFVRDYWS